MKKLVGVMVTVLLAVSARAQNLPAGTGLKMKLETSISTERSRVGSLFSGRTTEAVAVQGRTVIPVGASITGRVMKLSEPRRIRGTPEIVLRPDRITMPNGEQYAIAAVVVDTDKRSNTTVNDEGVIHGHGRSSHDNAEMLGGTAAGTTIGVLAGGAKGALLGGMMGATVTAAHWMTKRHSAALPAGSEITLELSRAVSLSVVSAGE